MSVSSDLGGLHLSTSLEKLGRPRPVPASLALAAALAALILLVAGLLTFFTGSDSATGGPAAVAGASAPDLLSAGHRDATGAQADQARATLADLPLRFEENTGQTDASVRFLSRGPGSTLFLTPREAVLTLLKPDAPDGLRGHGSPASTSGAVVRMGLAGSNRSPAISAARPLRAKSNYFSGAARHAGVPNYREVRYRSVYPGIDQIFHGRKGVLEYDFEVAPGANPEMIALDFRGVRG